MAFNNAILIADLLNRPKRDLICLREYLEFGGVSRQAPIQTKRVQTCLWYRLLHWKLKWLKNLRHALEIIWHNLTTGVVHVTCTGHSVMDCFQKIYLSTTLKPYKLQLDTLTSIGPYFGKIEETFICLVLSNLVGILVNQTLGCLSNDDSD